MKPNGNTNSQNTNTTRQYPLITSISVPPSALSRNIPPNTNMPQTATGRLISATFGHTSVIQLGSIYFLRLGCKLRRVGSGGNNPLLRLVAFLGTDNSGQQLITDIFLESLILCEQLVLHIEFLSQTVQLGHCSTEANHLLASAMLAGRRRFDGNVVLLLWLIVKRASSKLQQTTVTT
jgi:hypothetical protein